MQKTVVFLRLGFVGATLLLWRGLEGAPQTAGSNGYILGPEEGEILLVRNTKVIVKVNPRTGSRGMAAGTQQLPPGAGIPLHKHNSDEMLVLQKGAAMAILGDQRKLAAAGSTIFIPKGVWHGVEPVNEDSQLLWVVSPPGQEGYFREIGRHPGDPIKQLTPEEMEDIARKHGTVYRRD
jgi:quercetin dioxygenase-like cupin family protein